MTVNFEVGTDINIAALDVQNRVGIAMPTLPEEVQRLGLTVRKRNPSILMLVAMYCPQRHPQHYFPRQLRQRVREGRAAAHEGRGRYRVAGR
ncbi:MAG: efflux RND transporter permease subunit [Hymenobacter sp.]